MGVYVGPGSRLRVQGLMWRVQGLGLRCSGSGFRVSGPQTPIEHYTRSDVGNMAMKSTMLSSWAKNRTRAI